MRLIYLIGVVLLASATIIPAADAQAVQFVRPGLTIKITSAKIASDGTISVIYSLSDPAGLALDNTGVSTPGAVTLSFVAAVLPNNQTQYTSYTTRTASG